MSVTNHGSGGSLVATVDADVEIKSASLAANGKVYVLGADGARGEVLESQATDGRLRFSTTTAAAPWFLVTTDN